MKQLIIAILMVMPGIGFSQQPLELKDAVNIALRNSLSVEIARNNVKISGINNNYGIAGGLPYVNATVTDNEQSTNIDQKYSDATRNTQRNNVVNNSLQGALAGSILLFNGSRVVNAKGRLGIQEQMSQQQLVTRTMAVAANVMLKYYDIVRQQSYGKTLENSIAVSRKKLDIIKAQQSVGMANNADLFQAQVDLNTQLLAQQSQQLIIDQDKTDLLNLLTLNPDSQVVIRDTIIIDKDLSLDSLLKSIDNNPEIIAAGQQVDIAMSIQRETAALRYPSLNLNAGYTLSRAQYAAGFTQLNQQIGPYVGMGVNVPVFNGTVYKRQETIAGINAQNARISRDTLMLNYRTNLIRNWQAYKNSMLQLETARQNSEIAAKLLDLVMQRFQLRQNTILDVENAQQSYENASNLLINISYAAKASEIQLKRLTNRLNL